MGWTIINRAPKNGHLTHIDPKLYIKCPPQGYAFM